MHLRFSKAQPENKPRQAPTNLLSVPTITESHATKAGTALSRLRQSVAFWQSERAAPLHWQGTRRDGFVPATEVTWERSGPQPHTRVTSRVHAATLTCHAWLHFPTVVVPLVFRLLCILWCRKPSLFTGEWGIIHTVWGSGWSGRRCSWWWILMSIFRKLLETSVAWFDCLVSVLSYASTCERTCVFCVVELVVVLFNWIILYNTCELNIPRQSGYCTLCTCRVSIKYMLLYNCISLSTRFAICYTQLNFVR